MHSLLAKGLNFCPTPGELNMGDLMSDISRFHRNLRLKSFFNHEEDLISDPNDTWDPDFLNLSFHDSNVAFAHRDFKNKSTFNPKGPPSLEAYIVANEASIAQIKCKSPSVQNTSKDEKSALAELIQNKEITIKKADKGSSVVLMNTRDYITETEKLLNIEGHYRVDQVCQTNFHNDLIIKELELMLVHGEITHDTYDYLANSNPRTALLYSQPKIHKQTLPPPCRPIVSGNDSPSENISKLVDRFLKPIVHTIPSYLRDTTHFI